MPPPSFGPCQTKRPQSRIGNADKQRYVEQFLTLHKDLAASPDNGPHAFQTTPLRRKAASKAPEPKRLKASSAWQPILVENDADLPPTEKLRGRRIAFA